MGDSLERLDISNEDCIVERDDRVVIITMNRPEKKNSLSATMLVGLADAYTYVDENDDVRAAILTGAGGTFSSGMDLVSMNAPRSEYVEKRMTEEPNLHWKGLLRDYRCSQADDRRGRGLRGRRRDGDAAGHRHPHRG